VTLKAIDLFAGAGGLSEGFEAAGVHVALAQELHPQPGLTHALNHHNTPVVVGDVREVDTEVLRAVLARHGTVGEIDVIIGGPPCQGFSSAGKKQQNDPRNSLFGHFCRVVEAFRPKAIVFENVPGFRKAYNGHVYEEARCAFDAAGYDLEDQILNAANYGVPQGRQRFIMVGVRKDLGLKFRWPEATHSSKTAGLFDAPYKALVTVQEALSDLEFVQPGFEGHGYLQPAASAYQRARRANAIALFNHLATRHRPKAVAMFKHIPEGGTISQVPAAIRSAKRTMARLDRRGISNAVLALPDDLIHYSQHRIPSVREMARLQSFDDDYVFIGKRTSGFKERKVDVPQYTQVGNSVPPLLAKAIATAVIEMLGGQPEDLRRLNERREVANLVHGSSARAGYTLDGKSVVPLYNLGGEPLPLPIDVCAPRVVDMPPLVEWVAAERVGLKRQWMPEALAS